MNDSFLASSQYMLKYLNFRVCPCYFWCETKNEQLELNSLVEMAQQIIDQRSKLITDVMPEQANNAAMSALFQVGTSEAS